MYKAEKKTLLGRAEIKFVSNERNHGTRLDCAWCEHGQEFDRNYLQHTSVCRVYIESQRQCHEEQQSQKSQDVIKFLSSSQNHG